MSWRTSDSIANVSAALVEAVGALSDVTRSREAKIETRGGGSYGYKYADLADALAMVRPVMSANGLAVLQTASGGEGSAVLITTTILHRSGEWIEFEPLEMPSGRTAQETGSAITYGRRYALLAALGLATEDDDGASAAPRGARRETPAKRAAAPAKPAAPRTEAEEEIRRLLAGQTSDVAAELRSAFRAHFDSTLVDLDPARHAEALDWVRGEIVARDEADLAWVAAATEDTP